MANSKFKIQNARQPENSKNGTHDCTTVTLIHDLHKINDTRFIFQQMPRSKPERLQPRWRSCLRGMRLFKSDNHERIMVNPIHDLLITTDTRLFF
jgi:hypothetical protein